MTTTMKQYREWKCMLSNFDMEGFGNDLQRTKEKTIWGRRWGRLGTSQESSQGVPGTSREPPESIWEATGEARGLQEHFLTSFLHFSENSGAMLGGKIGTKRRKNR